MNKPTIKAWWFSEKQQKEAAGEDAIAQTFSKISSGVIRLKLVYLLYIQVDYSSYSKYNRVTMAKAHLYWKLYK